MDETESVRYKKWSDNEKIQILSLVHQVKLRYPGVVKLASAKGNIKFYRLTKHDLKGITGSRLNALAICRDGFLVITDAFFLSPQKLHSLTHELIHLADSGGKFSLSDSFVKFATPILRKARQRIAEDLLLRRNVPWLSAYPWLPNELSTDYGEIFAEYSSRQSAQTSEFQTELFHPRERDIKSIAHIMDGERFLKTGSWEKASFEFQRIHQLSPNASMCHIYLARCNYQLGEYEKAESELELVLAHWKKLSVSFSDPTCWRSKFLLARVKMCLERYSEAEILLSELTDSHVYDLEIFRSRAECAEKMENWDKALLDWYAYYFFKVNHAALALDWVDFSEDHDLIRDVLANEEKRTALDQNTRSNLLESLFRAHKHSPESDQLIADAIEAVRHYSATYSQQEKCIRIAYLSAISGKPFPIEEFKPDEFYALERGIIRFILSNHFSDDSKIQYESLRRAISTSKLNGKTWLF